MSGDRQLPADDTLYALLPAVYRLRDTLDQDHPLQALLRAIAGQVDEFTADIGRLYDNWFIETCEDDLVPYFAMLVGLSLGPTMPSPAQASTDAVWRRRQVADAIGDRRRKGTFSVLEQLAADATGWPALAVQSGPVLMATQSVRFADIGRRRLPDTKDMEALELLTSPLSDAATLADVRRLGSHRTPGSGNPSGIAVWLWRLVADRVDRAPAASAGDESHFTFDQLGRDHALAVIPAADANSPPPTDLDVATPITRRALDLRLEDYYGPGRSICIYRGSELVPRSRILVADLARWRANPPVGHVTVDPRLGRIAFPSRHPPEEEITVTCAHLSIGAIGGGHYQRPLVPPTDPVYRVATHGSGTYRSVRAALKAWRQAQETRTEPGAVIEIGDDGVFREHLNLRLKAGERLEIRAAQGRRPILIPEEPGGGRSDQFRVHGSEEPGAADPPRFALDGVWVARHSLDLHGAFGAVELRHCTLVPAGGLIGVETGEARRAPSLVVHSMPCPISIRSCVIGRIRVEPPEAGFDALPLDVADSVLDASNPRGLALLGDDERPAWVQLTLSRVTVLGGAHVHSVGVVQDCILTGPLDCERRQVGEVRFSFIPPGSRTPRRIACQPDRAIAAMEADESAVTPPVAGRSRRAPGPAARLAPRFDGIRFGDPAYARLAADVAVELTQGAHDEGELGAYHDLWQALRVADLRARLAEFVPAATDFDIRFAT